ncbi:hypothetical protein JCM17960_05500 [Magnetospira thiophila]
MEYKIELLIACIVFADLWAINKIVDLDLSVGGKLVWIIPILIFPVFGLIGWLAFGPRRTRRPRRIGGFE